MAKKQYKHLEHIIAVSSANFYNRRLGFSTYQLKASDIIIAQRKILETTDAYRQVLPVNLFVCNGKIWTYRRTEKGGESKLHGKVAVLVGGHWDITDLVFHQEKDMEGMINLEASLDNAIKRELEEEVTITSRILSTKAQPVVVCADDENVDRHHVALVYVHELDSEGVSSNEEELEELGFLTPEQLLDGSHDLETWTKIAIKIVSGDIPSFDKGRD